MYNAKNAPGAHPWMLIVLRPSSHVRDVYYASNNVVGDYGDPPALDPNTFVETESGPLPVDLSGALNWWWDRVAIGPLPAPGGGPFRSTELLQGLARSYPGIRFRWEEGMPDPTGQRPGQGHKLIFRNDVARDPELVLWDPDREALNWRIRRYLGPVWQAN